MKEISLTQGKVALVDDADYELVSRYKWCALPHGNTYYAYRWSASRKFPRQRIWMHREIANPLALMPVDHRDGNGLNNCRANLRTCTQAQNTRNRRKNPGSNSPYKGIYPSSGKWVAEISANGKRFQLGRFTNPEEAARAYDQAAMRLHGEFACINGV